MFQRILVPLDGSARAERAIPIAARLARHAGGFVLLLRVLMHPLDAVASFLHPPEETEQAVEAARAQAVSYLEQVAHSIVITGTDVAETIIRLAEQDHQEGKDAEASRYALIALATHGRHGTDLWVMGSVTERILEASPLPLLVVRPRQHTQTNEQVDS